MHGSFSITLQGQAERRGQCVWNPQPGGWSWLSLPFSKMKAPLRGNTETLTVGCATQCLGRPREALSRLPCVATGQPGLQSSQVENWGLTAAQAVLRLVGPAGSCLCHGHPRLDHVNLRLRDGALRSARVTRAVLRALGLHLGALAPSSWEGPCRGQHLSALEPPGRAPSGHAQLGRPGVLPGSCLVPLTVVPGPSFPHGVAGIGLVSGISPSAAGECCRNLVCCFCPLAATAKSPPLPASYHPFAGIACVIFLCLLAGAAGHF